MTGFLHEEKLPEGQALTDRQFSRKTFVKGGGALIIGFSSLGALAGKADAATGLTPFAARGPQDYLPDVNQVDTWFAIDDRQQADRHPRRDGARSRYPDRHPHAHRGRDQHDHGPDGLCASRVVAERHGRR